MENTMDAKDIKAFIPNKDYELSESLYSGIGFDSEYLELNKTSIFNFVFFRV